jgi:hypothetical protein
MIRVAKELRPEVVERILATVPNGFECPICYDASENPRIISPCGHDTCSECLSRLMDNANVQSLAEGNHDGSGQAKCPECRAVLTKAVTDLACFKKVHMPELTAAEDAGDDTLLEILNAADDCDSDSDTSDDSDDSDADDLEDFVVSDGHETSDDDGGSGDESMEDLDWKSELAKKKAAPAKENAEEESGSDYEEHDGRERSKAKSKAKAIAKAIPGPKPRSKVKGKGKGKGKGKAKSNEKTKRPKDKERKTLGQLKAESSRNKESKRKYMKYLKKTWETSGKIQKCVEILGSVREADSSEKTIVFSQWTSLLDLLEVPVSAQKWKFQRYGMFQYLPAIDIANESL